MPVKPKKPCAYPGCPNLTYDRYCEKHKQMENKRYEKYDRDPEVYKRYDRKWRKIRKSYLSVNPLCEQCLKEGKYVRAVEVHHKLLLSKGGTHDKDNLMALCKSCHSKIHAKSGDRWGKH